MQDVLFEELSLVFDRVTFVGNDDDVFNIPLPKPNLVIGLHRGIREIEVAPRGLKILFTCNSHVSERNARLRQSAKKWSLSVDELQPEITFRSAYRAADYFMIAENELGIETYTRRGIPANRILRYNNAVDADIWVQSEKVGNTVKFVHWATLGLRKGLPALIEAWRMWYKGQDAELHLIGQETKVLRELMPKIIAIPGIFLDSGQRNTWSTEFRERLGSFDVSVFPTLEDAQPSALLESACCGAEIITTHESGVDFPNVFCTYVTADCPSTIADAIEKNFRRIRAREAKGESREYVLDNHSWPIFRSRFAEILTTMGYRRNDS